MKKNYEVEIDEVEEVEEVEEVVIDEEELESLINDYGKDVKAFDKEIRRLFKYDDEDYLINRLNAY